MFEECDKYQNLMSRPTVTFMVKVLKFRTLFSFCYKIICWFSGLELQNDCQNSKQGLRCFSSPFRQATNAKFFRTSTIVYLVAMWLNYNNKKANSHL